MKIRTVFGVARLGSVVTLGAMLLGVASQEGRGTLKELAGGEAHFGRSSSRQESDRDACLGNVLVRFTVA